MRNATAALARSITRAGSKQAYYTARLMADNDLVSDFYRAYAYFRWVDDTIDVSSQSNDERISFIRRQRELIDCLYRNQLLDDLTPEEEMAADLISHDRGENSGLQSFIRNMLVIIEFDACRKGRLISQQELTWYSNCLGKSVTDGIQYFIGNGRPYPVSDGRCLAAIAAHITHLLRDMLMDAANGFINIPCEYLEAHGISPEDVDSPPFRAWVRGRVDQARQYFCEGKRYLDQLDVWRCKIVGYWYCARFEGVLDAIERDGYILRAVYNERYKLSTLLKIAWLGLSVTLRHIARRGRKRG
jgi:phytoene/squalene synthetase